MITTFKVAEIFSSFIASLIAYFLITIFSGCFQAYVAKKLGDHTGEEAGFLSLNPMTYFDPLGFTLFILTGFGWSKPVPINPDNFTGRYKRLEALFSYGSHVVANAVLALIMIFIVVTCFGGFSHLYPIPSIVKEHPLAAQALGLIIFRMARFSIFFTLFSFLLAIFRVLVLYGFSKFDLAEWHEAEIVSLLLALVLFYIFEGPINYFMQFVIFNTEALLWYWWSALGTLLGFGMK